MHLSSYYMKMRREVWTWLIYTHVLHLMCVVISYLYLCHTTLLCVPWLIQIYGTWLIHTHVLHLMFVLISHQQAAKTYLYVYSCTYTCIHIHTHTYICIHVYTWKYTFIIHTHTGAPWSVQDNSSMSCKDIVIRVTMPDTKFSTVKLDVNTNEFLVQSPKFLLALPLSENVDSDKGSGTFIWMFIHIYVYIYINIIIRIYVYIYVCECVCECVYIFIYLYVYIDKGPGT